MAGERILVVDDSLVNLELAEYTLQQAGYAVATASDATEAQAALEAQRPDLILMDIQLPGMDGLELTRVIKADPRFAGVKIVALTSYAMKGDEEKAVEAGCDGYITKPIEPRAFPAKVAAFLAA